MSVEKGHIAELEFLVQAARRNLVVSSTRLPCSYDFLVDNGKRVLKVQIKSTFSKGPVYGLNISKGACNRIYYKKSDVDIIACFIDELKSWYIFPIEVLEKKIKLSLIPDSIESKWNKYRDAWSSLLN